MPDPNRETVSATQAPALFSASPYLTRWMLWKHFADDMPIEADANPRMDWGLKMQPLIIAQAADDLAMEVTPHDETYIRRGQLGATRDAQIVAPDVGPGALETKCVFDYRTWMSEWGGGKSVPKHHEMQLQQQMLVGDGKTSFQWGVIAAWVAGEVHYFKRAPIPKLWKALETEVAVFFVSITKRQEPDPFGSTIELPFLQDLERAAGSVVDLSIGEKAQELVTAARLYVKAGEEASAAERLRKSCKAKLLGALGTAESAILAGGGKLETKVSKRRHGYTVEPTEYTTLKVFAPGDIIEDQREAFRRSTLEAG